MSSTFKLLPDVHNAMLDKAAESGLPPDLAKRLSFKAYLADEVGSLGLPIQKAGFKIPYHDFQGLLTTFWRFRFLERTNEGFAALTDKKDVRYLQPKKSVNEVYIPPIINWGKVIADATIPIVITEGELKAACACAVGIPTLGLGGVW